MKEIVYLHIKRNEIMIIMQFGIKNSSLDFYSQYLCFLIFEHLITKTHETKFDEVKKAQ